MRLYLPTITEYSTDSAGSVTVALAFATAATEGPARLTTSGVVCRWYGVAPVVSWAKFGRAMIVL